MHVGLEPQLHLVEIQVVGLGGGPVGILRRAPLPPQAETVLTLHLLDLRVSHATVTCFFARMGRGLAVLVLLRLPSGDEHAGRDEDGARLARVGHAVEDVPGDPQVRDLRLHDFGEHPARGLLRILVRLVDDEDDHYHIKGDQRLDAPVDEPEPAVQDPHQLHGVVGENMIGVRQALFDPARQEPHLRVSSTDLAQSRKRRR
mmetsp:Transcript_46778/g.111194  ORF Transcript_46778/g.111194 Transcript_46778/m.111194 type:complete len:202 (-) Transcript_46778:76-681(-)